MDWLRPIWINRRSGSSFSRRTKTVLLATTAIFFIGITISVFTPTRRPNQGLGGDRIGCSFPTVFNFGDSNSVTGGKSAAFHRLPDANGETFFHRPSGRYCDGKVILDFVAEKLGLPYVSAYLDSMGTDFRHGANFATGGSTIQPVDVTIFGAGLSPISLDFQLLQFKQFKAQTEEMFNQASNAYAKTSLPRPEDFSKALYTVDIGQNDLHFGLTSMTEDELKASLPNIIDMLAQTVKELHQLGGRAFWIHNTGPIGCLPYALGLPYVSAYMDSMGTNFRHGANFATGGSTIQPVGVKIFRAGFSPISLDIQLLQFKQFKARTEEMFNQASNAYAKTSLPRPEDFSKALYTVDIGQNDLHFGLTSMTEDELKASLPNIIDMLAQTVKELHQLGGRAFWIHNTGPIGCLPYAAIRSPPKPENVDQNGCAESHNRVAREFNRLLKEKVSELRVELTDAALAYVDVYSAKYSLISEAKKHGFENPLGYCCGHYGDYYVQCGKKAIVNGTEIYGSACKDPSKYINWDGVHYSHSANQFIALQIHDGSLSDPPIPITQACKMTSSSR